MKIEDPLKSKDIDDTLDAFVKIALHGVSPEYPDAYFQQAVLLNWYRALNRPDTQASLQKNGKITSQQAIKMFDEYAQKARTREGNGQIVVEIVKAIKTAPEYVPQIKKASHLSQRHSYNFDFP